MKRKILGIPIILIVIVLTFTLTATSSFALWHFSQQNNASVTVKASNAVLYKDAGCTQLLLTSDPLAFGDVRISSPSSTVTVYLKNTGDDPIMLVMSVSSLGANLALKEGTYGTISTLTKLYTPASSVFTPAGGTQTVGVVCDAVQTTFDFFTDVGVPTTYPFYFKVDNEVIQCTSKVSGYKYNVLRAQIGTTATSHALGVTCTFGTVTITPAVPLAPGAVQTIALHIEASAGAVSGADPFVITIEADSGF